MRVHDTAWDQMDDEPSVPDNQGVASIVPPCIAHDDVRGFRVRIDDLSLAFVAPLSADY
jgi:hypothetical protein